MSDRLVVVPDPCPAGWPGCDGNYTGGHYCTKSAGHAGRHVCECGATSSAPAPVSDTGEET